MSNNSVLCGASEKGKLIVNMCLDLGIKLNPASLEKLLIIMHGKMLSKYGKTFFKEDVVALESGLSIKEINEDFKTQIFGFTEKFSTHVCLLNWEGSIFNEVIRKYANFDVFELNEMKELKILKELCYEEQKQNIVPDFLIEQVFDYYQFYDNDIVKQNEAAFQKRLKYRK